MVIKNKSTDTEEVTFAGDIITDALNVVKEILAKQKVEVDPAIFDESDKIIRAKWWGDRPYIGQRASEGRSQRNEAIYRDYNAGERIAYLACKYGRSEMQIRRIIEGMRVQKK